MTIEKAGIIGGMAIPLSQMSESERMSFEYLHPERVKVKESKPNFKELDSVDLKNILDKTIKKDENNKLINFLGDLSAYTEDSQFNIIHSSPSSSGKSYIPIEVSQLFPKEDVILVGYCSPTAFFHDNGAWDKKNKCYIVDFSQKILIFLDQPHTLLLQHLRPLLSHDQKTIELKITDKSQKHGLRTKKVILKGFPVVIFCTANLKLDEQEATRFFLLSPETNQDKIREGIDLKIEHDSDKELFKDWLMSDEKRNELMKRIVAIKMEHITQIIIDTDLRVKLKNRFYGNINSLKPRHQRDIGRLISLVKTFALLNLWFRERRENIIYANENDLNESVNLWNQISESQEMNLSPFVYGIYKDVIQKNYSESKGGASRQEISKKYFDVYNRTIPDWQLRQEVIPMLENCGLITSEQDSKDRRKMLYTPTTQLTIDIEPKNYSESKGGVESDTNVCSLCQSKDVYLYVIDKWLCESCYNKTREEGT